MKKKKQQQKKATRKKALISIELKDLREVAGGQVSTVWTTSVPPPPPSTIMCPW